MATIRGVRSYDSNAGTWTTPDPYASDVDDPASQKSYMWNGNNPESYADPSGYAVTPDGQMWEQAEADLDADAGLDGDDDEVAFTVHPALDTSGFLFAAGNAAAGDALANATPGENDANLASQALKDMNTILSVYGSNGVNMQQTGDTVSGQNSQGNSVTIAFHNGEATVSENVGRLRAFKIMCRTALETTCSNSK